MMLNKRILLELKKHTVWVFTFLSNMPKQQKNYYRKRLKKCVLEIHSLFYDAIARSLSFAHDRQEECVINEKRRETCL